MSSLRRSLPPARLLLARRCCWVRARPPGRGAGQQPFLDLRSGSCRRASRSRRRRRTSRAPRSRAARSRRSVRAMRFIAAPASRRRGIGADRLQLRARRVHGQLRERRHPRGGAIDPRQYARRELRDRSERRRHRDGVVGAQAHARRASAGARSHPADERRRARPRRAELSGHAGSIRRSPAPPMSARRGPATASRSCRSGMSRRRP